MTSFYLFIIYLFLERGEGRETERERNIDVQEKHRSFCCLLHEPQIGVKNTAQACALTKNGL